MTAGNLTTYEAPTCAYICRGPVTHSCSTANWNQCKMSSRDSHIPPYPSPVVGEQCSVIGSRILAYNEDDQTVPGIFKFCAMFKDPSSLWPLTVVFQRKYTVLKVLNYSRGAGCASAVSLCAWHTPASLKPNLPPLFKRPRYGEENQIVVVKSRLNGGLQRDESKLTELMVNAASLRNLPCSMD